LRLSIRGSARPSLARIRRSSSRSAFSRRTDLSSSLLGRASLAPFLIGSHNGKEAERIARDGRKEKEEKEDDEKEDDEKEDGEKAEASHLQHGITSRHPTRSRR